MLRLILPCNSIIPSSANRFTSEQPLFFSAVTQPYSSALGSPKYFSIPKGTRRPSCLLKKGLCAPNLKAKAAFKDTKPTFLYSDSFTDRYPINFFNYFSQRKLNSMETTILHCYPYSAFISHFLFCVFDH